MPQLCRAAAALACLTLFVPPGVAADAVPASHSSPWLRIRTYDSDGVFVSGPARTAGMTTLILVGGALAVACTPADLVYGLAQREGYGTVSAACASQAGQAAAGPFYLAVGAPFWLLKATFWDAPRALLRRQPSESRVKPDLG